MTALVGLSLLATVIVGVAAKAAPPPAQPVQNGNFDTDPVGGAYYTAPPGSISNWTVDSGSVDLLNTYIPDHTTGSANSVDMDGGTPGAISQVVSTLAHQQYTIQFYMSGNNGSNCAGASPATTKMLKVLWNGVQQGATLTFDAAASPVFTFQSVPVVADATGSSTIGFASADDAACASGAVIDDVALIPADVVGATIDFSAQATLPTGTITIGNVNDLDNLDCGDVAVVSIDWGDSSGLDTTTGSLSAPGDGSCDITGSHTYTTAGSYDVVAVVSDVDETTSPYTIGGGVATVAAADVTGSTNNFHAEVGVGTGTIKIGNVVDQDDSGCFDIFVNYINWGDGSGNDTTTGATSEPGDGSCDLTGSHTYAAIGSYNVSVAVNDPDEGNYLITGGVATVSSLSTLTITSAAYEIDIRGTSSHNITAAISPAAAGVPVLFTVTGANAQTSPPRLTNAAGIATWSGYIGNVAGHDVITACANRDTSNTGCNHATGTHADIASGNSVAKDFVSGYTQVSGTTKINKKPYQFSGFLGQAGTLTVGSITIGYPNGKSCTITTNGSSTYSQTNGAIPTSTENNWTSSGNGCASSTTVALAFQGPGKPPGNRGALSVDINANGITDVAAGDVSSGANGQPISKIALTSGKVTIKTA